MILRSGLRCLKNRNLAAYIHDEDMVDTLILLIRDSFIPAFSRLEKTLQDKLKECGGEE